MRSDRKLPLWQESVLLIATAVVLAVIVKTFFVQAFYIPSGSMEQTLLINDRVLVQKVSYWTGDPSRGDVVVFDDPGGWLGDEDGRQPGNVITRGLELIGLYPTGGHLIKRVIGVGGDHVECCDKQGRITINDKPLDEEYVLDQDATSDKTFDVKVPKHYLWVMGDNRANSADSREHMGDPGGGFIASDEVVGKAWLRVWPLKRAGFMHRPDVFDTTTFDRTK